MWTEVGVVRFSSLKPMVMAKRVACSPTSSVCVVCSIMQRATAMAPFTLRRSATAPTSCVVLEGSGILSGMAVFFTHTAEETACNGVASGIVLYSSRAKQKTRASFAIILKKIEAGRKKRPVLVLGISKIWHAYRTLVMCLTHP